MRHWYLPRWPIRSLPKSGQNRRVLNPLEGLTEEEIAGGLDYIGVMRQNLEALKPALNE
ncbi:hypothetical protein HMSSN036_71660 [Paenibacillus macerans]|nr:hypothetical protein HMSSN036_71660 [Paenibacillus macerans]